jgi:hypothetical protein
MNAHHYLAGVRVELLLRLLLALTVMLAGYALILASRVLCRYAMVRSRVHWLLYELADFTGYSEEHPWAIFVSAVIIGSGLIYAGGFIGWLALTVPGL